MSTLLVENIKHEDATDNAIVLDSNGNVGIGTNSPVVSLDINSTGAMRIPSGTTAQRPGSPGIGYTRYNTNTLTIEFYNGTGWVGTNLIPSINSITGEIYNTLSSSLTFSVNNATDTVDVDFLNSGGTVIETVASIAVSSGSFTISVPSSVYNQSTGSTITITVKNQDGTPSSNNIIKTVIGIPSGGTITTSGNYRIHTFLSSGNFVVPTGFSTNIETLIVAGGGGGGIHSGGGGGGGGLLYYVSETPKTPNGGAISVGAGTHSVIVGAGAAQTTGQYSNSTIVGQITTTGQGASGYNGGNSSLNISGGSTYTAIGGGGGGYFNTGGHAGGCGGGGARNHAGGAGTSGQGNNGGDGTYGNISPYPGAGGGGAGAVGQVNTAGLQDGGVGLQYSISGSATYYAGGGGGNTQYVADNGFNDAGSGGLGGGGRGGYGTQGSGGRYDSENGIANTGGGGGGAQYDTGNNPNQNGGGSGIVIIRYQV